MKLEDYDKRMFLLSVASCAGQECKGRNIDLDVYCAITQALSNKDWALEGWEIVWGPGVRVMESAIAALQNRNSEDKQRQVFPADVMFVARKGSAYFVSVAATNYLSVFDIEEDFKIWTLRPWPYSSSRQQSGKISHGFHESLKILQTLRPARGLPGEGLTLGEFLAQEVKPAGGDLRIITGGHSQGGATSPLVALWLLDTQADWDPRRKASFSCYRSAGPTPGDAEFAAYYDARVPETVSLVNRHDFVTRMFVESEMATIPRMYEPLIDPTPEIRSLVGSMMVLAARGNYKQIAQDPDTQLVDLSADVNMGIYEGGTPTPCEMFTKQMGYQHAQAYFDLLSVEADVPVDQFVDMCG